MPNPPPTLPIDRGLHYGDGLFETVRVVDGRAPLWSWHWERLLEGCARLGLPQPDSRRLLRALGRQPTPWPGLVVKLMWTAAAGARGYARGPSCAMRLRVWRAPMLAAGGGCDGLRARWCRLRLAVQPALSGIKHLNRLEQVLARAEWSDPTIDEGLMLDTDGQLVAATAANLLLRQQGRWRTPRLDRCGIAGVGRHWCMQRLAVEEARLAPADLLAAEQVLLVNALHGPRPLLGVDERSWSPDAEVRSLRAQWDAQFGGPR